MQYLLKTPIKRIDLFIAKLPFIVEKTRVWKFPEHYYLNDLVKGDLRLVKKGDVIYLESGYSGNKWRLDINGYKNTNKLPDVFQETM